MTALRIGVISDTHGLVRPQALDFLRGCSRILHAGDICDAAVLEQLSAVAPVTAVRGNNDRGAGVSALPHSERIDLGSVRIYMVHDVAEIDIDPRAAGVRVVISGHSHRPLQEERDGVLFFNPGSAGPRRFRLPISIGELLVEGSRVTPRLVTLS